MHRRRMPPLVALRAFEAAARLQSIKAAADELCVTPAAVSQQIKKLEDDLELELLKRSHRSITLTKEGARLSQSLLTAFNQISEGVREIAPKKGKRCIVFECPPPFSAKFLAPRITGFLVDNPDIDVRVSVHLEKVDYARYGVDIGVRVGASADRDLSYSEPFWEHKVPLASPEYIAEHGLASAENLTDATLLTKDFGALMPNLPDWEDWYAASGAGHSEEQRTVCFGPQCDQAYDAAVAGAGVVLGEVINGSSLIQSGRLQCPFGPMIPLGIAYRVAKKAPSREDDAVIAFENWLTSELATAASRATQLAVASENPRDIAFARQPGPRRSTTEHRPLFAVG